MSTAPRSTSQEYLRLIRRFPLMPIRSTAQLRQAAQVVDELSDQMDALTEDERAYFDVLCDLIKHYESAMYKSPSQMEPAEALRFLMKENNLSQSDLARETDVPKSRLSAFLSGARGLSKANAFRLADRFRLSPTVFLR